jgi:uncharacterized protein (TIGR03382 family)
MSRRAALLTLLVFAPACSDGGCGDALAPLTSPIANGAFFSDAAVARVSPAGVTFIETNLPPIIGSLASSSCTDVPCPAGWGACDGAGVCKSTDPTTAFIGIKIPPTVVNDPGVYFEELRICTSHRSPTFDDCNIYVDVTDVDLQPNANNNTLGVTADVTIWSSTIKMHLYGAGILEPDFNCDIRVRNANNQNLPIYKTVGANVSFDASNPLGRLEMNPSPISVDIVENDLVLCGILEWDIIKGLIFGFIEDSIKSQLQDTVHDVLTGLLRESCEEGPCTRPDASFCNGDGFCQFNAGGELVPRLLGMEGTLAVDALLGGFAGDAATLSFSAAASSASTASNALTMSMRAAAVAPSSDCVPSFPAPNPTLPAYAPSGSSWHVAIGASDKLLNTVVYRAFDAGGLCQTIAPGAVTQLSSGALSLLVPSLDEITGGSVPLAIDMRPRTPPRVEIGRNVTGPDPSDPAVTILLEPLLNVVLDDFDLDVYAHIDGVLLRVLTLRVDLNLDLSLALGGTGELVLVAGDASNWLVDVDVIHSDVLRESPEDIEAAIPTLLGIVLPMLTESLAQVFEVPSFSGFTLGVNGIGGSQAFGTTTHGDHERFAHLSVTASLSYDPNAARAVRAHTAAEVVELHVPLADQIRAGERVSVRIAADVLGRDPALPPPTLWHRVDGGLWRPPVDARELIVRDPVLHAEGMHFIEVAVAHPGAPATLDLEPVVLPVLIDAHVPVIDLVAGSSSVQVFVSDTVALPHEIALEARVDGALLDALTLDDDGMALVAIDTSRHELVVTAVDTAGRISEARIGTRVVEAGDVLPAEVAAPMTTQRLDDVATTRGHCAQTDGTSTAAVLALALLLRWRRRR